LPLTLAAEFKQPGNSGPITLLAIPELLSLRVQYATEPSPRA